MKNVILISLVALALALFMPFCSAELNISSEEPMNINFSTWHRHDSIEVQTVWIPMLEVLKEKSNGQITYILFNGEALGSGPEHYDIVANGSSDMGYATLTWTPGRFPLTDVLSLPASVKCKEVASSIGNAMYDRILYAEFPDVKMLELNGCINSYLWTAQPVYSLEDVKGLRIRSPGGLQTGCIKAIGAEPIFMPLDDVYLAMENGTIDGIVTCPPMILSYRLYEVANYGTLVTFGCVDEGLFMNLNSWEQTPDTLKPLIEEVCQNPYRTTGGMTQETYMDMMGKLDERGVDFYALPHEEAELWYNKFQEVTRGWVADLESKGLPAKEAVVMFDQECTKRGVECVACPPEWR